MIVTVASAVSSAGTSVVDPTTWYATISVALGLITIASAILVVGRRMERKS
jgi:hypothetical protein